MPDGSNSIADLRAAFDELHRSWAEYTAANDRKLAEIAKRGAADPLDREKLARLDERIDQLTTALKRTGAPPQSDPDAPLSRKSAAAFMRLVEGSEVDPASVDLDTVAGYQKAFGKYLRRGSRLNADEAKALQVGVDADGGYWVSPQMGDMVSRLFDTSPVRSVARVVTLASSDALEYPVDPNEATSGGWVGEVDSRAETATPQVANARIPAHEQYCNPRITQKLLDDAGFDVEGWLAEKVADIMVRTENTAFVNGDGVARPRGFLDYGADSVTTDDASRSWGVLRYFASGQSAGFASSNPADPLIECALSLKAAYRANAAWSMNRATLAEVRKLKDTNGQYLWTPVSNAGTASIVGGTPALLLGYPVVEMEDMPDIAANSFSIAFGDWRRAYTVVERQGTRTLRDPYSAKPYVQFYTTRRVGGDVVDFDALRLFKFSGS